MNKFFTRLIIYLMPVLFATHQAAAQEASGMPHSFTVSAAAIPGFPAGFANIIPANADETVQLISPAAGSWNFTFANQVYTKAVLSTNGWLALMPNSVLAVPGTVTPLPNNQLNNNTTGYPIIAPLWDNLSTAVLSWVVPAGTNTLWVRWSSKWDASNTSTLPLVYIALNGNNNTITYYYPPLPYTPTNANASIGIAGICAGDFYSVYSTAGNAAYVDSVTENTNIGSSAAAPNVRPYNTTYIFTAYHPYDNCSGSYPARSLTLSGSCVNVLASTFNATVSGSGNCSTTDDNDVWFSLIKPVNVTSFTITTSPATCGTVTGTSVEVYAGCGGAMIGCASTSTTYPGYGEVSISRGCAAETLYVRVTADGDVAGKFQICATSGGGGAGATCATAVPICSLPYTMNGATTAGSGNDYDSTSSACHTTFMNGEDFVFAYQPSSNQCVRINLTSAGQNPGVFIYSGCPNSGGVNCIGSAEVTTGNAVINSVSLVSGQTYYIVVDNEPSGGNTNVPFDISVTAVGTSNSYDVCASAFNLGTIGNSVSCTPQTFSTECSTPSAAGTVGQPTCIPGNNPPYFIDGVTGDVWLRFTAGFNGSLLINTFQSASNPTANAAMAIYQGASCPGAGAPYACDYNSGPNGLMPSLSIPVTNGQTYYIRVWTENPYNTGNFDICFQSACAPPNDLPCAAVLVPMGGTVTGFNTCASGTSEPPNAAQCPASGTINTVWYKAVVPASGSIRVRTHPLTLTDTQIQGYTFASGCANSAVTYSAKACNDDGAACSGGFNDFSEALYSGLPVGDTLFVAVDGNGSLTGSFEISMIDGTGTVFPPVNQQDCGSPQIVCSTADIVVADPGFRNYGNVCDLPSGYGCWFTGERNSVWYQFTVDPALSGGTATLAFDVFTLSSVDIDVLVWDITGNANPCPAIQAQTLPIAGCNYAAAAAATGLSPGGTGAYSNAITFTGAPRTYLLLLNNWNSSNNAHFTIDWRTTPISTTPTSSTWSGASDTLYTTTTNWGSCGTTPSCATDATVNATVNGRQPTITAGLPNKTVRNLTINAGATLRIKAGATLSVCGNFTNYGTLICEPTSTIQFVGSGLQTVNGNLTGPNSFANLVINKPSGSVQLQTNIDVNEDFTTTNATSIFNIGGRYMRVAGNFTNNTGGTTFTGIGGSTVEFFGNKNQNFTNVNSAITLNRVTMNKTAGKVYLTGANSRMNIDTALTMTSGNIVTRSLAALEVNVKYYQPTAVNAGNANSFIEGKLRRKIANPTGPASPPLNTPFYFPLGDSATPGPPGYNLAAVTFTSATLVYDLLGTFNLWPGGTAPNPGPAAMECVVATYSNRPIFNNGYWTFSRSTSTFGGNYDLALNNMGYTNNTGLGWTIAVADLAANVSLSASWRLQGQCVITSTPGNTMRSSFNNPARDSTSFNHHYSTVQSDMILPIELLSFTAEPSGEDVLCKWVTASEINNAYFEIERSKDGKTFESAGFVNGFGPGVSTETREYSFRDVDACKGLQYYRLKQVDIDGAFARSEIVAVSCRSFSGIDVFPNPAFTEVNYRFNSEMEGQVVVQLTDIAGRIIQTDIVDVSPGINQLNNDIQDLASGVYYLQISESTGEINLKGQFFKK